MPTRRLRLMTSQRPEQLRDALQARILHGFPWGFSRDPVRVFRGKVDDRGFLVQCIPRGRNSWMPQCKGTFHPAGAVTEVEVEMRLHPLVLVFGWVWAGTAGMAGVGGILIAVTRGEVAGLVPVGMVAFFFALSLGAFTMGANQSERELHATFGV